MPADRDRQAAGVQDPTGRQAAAGEERNHELTRRTVRLTTERKIGIYRGVQNE